MGFCWFFLEEADLEEEEELDDEDEPVSAAKLLGHHHQVQGSYEFILL